MDVEVCEQKPPPVSSTSTAALIPEDLFNSVVRSLSLHPPPPRQGFFFPRSPERMSETEMRLARDNLETVPMRTHPEIPPETELRIKQELIEEDETRTEEDRARCASARTNDDEDRLQIVEEEELHLLKEESSAKFLSSIHRRPMPTPQQPQKAASWTPVIPIQPISPEYAPARFICKTTLREEETLEVMKAEDSKEPSAYKEVLFLKRRKILEKVKARPGEGRIWMKTEFDVPVVTKRFMSLPEYKKRRQDTELRPLDTTKMPDAFMR